MPAKTFLELHPRAHERILHRLRLASLPYDLSENHCGAVTTGKPLLLSRRQAHLDSDVANPQTYQDSKSLSELCHNQSMARIRPWGFTWSTCGRSSILPMRSADMLQHANDGVVLWPHLPSSWYCAHVSRLEALIQRYIGSL